MRAASRAGGDMEVNHGKGGAGTEALTTLEAEIIQTGGHHVVLQEEDIIVRYDGPTEQEEGEEEGGTEDEEMRLAESMSMAVFLNLNNSQDSRQDPKRRRSNLKDINQLETVDEASRGEISL